MTNEQLVSRIQSGENVAENMEQLYEQTKKFIHAIAWKYKDCGELEDLEQEGYLALYPAIDGYDPAAGCKFLTYAEKWIQQRMKRYLQMNGSCMRLPVHCMGQIRKYHRFCTEYEQETGKSPSDYTAACFMGISMEQLENIKVNACMAHLGSLDAPVTGADGGEDTTVGELTGDGQNMEEDVLDRIDAEQLHEVLWTCVDSLPGEQPDVLRMRYQGKMTLSEIGRQRGTTPEAVRQIHAKALRSLRGTRYRKKLLPFVPEYERIYSRSLIGCGVGHFARTWTSSTERTVLEELERRER